MKKQTPRQFQIPPYTSGNFYNWVLALGREVHNLVNNIRNDLDNGATTFPYESLTVIADVDANDFEEGQIRFYKDTTTSKIWLVTVLDSTVYKVELTT